VPLSSFEGADWQAAALIVLHISIPLASRHALGRHSMAIYRGRNG
jgi:hypothetical protein